ncbi:diaminopropionate ammonia-lyase [Pikeienuella piscinae]|uniref:Diaminopropionate ammonia-lyase n=1 Tax=Pikeienuella piscinae TaxID=2748098 RepID=A0A7L5BXU6_9RHOB|nr:diaminopropionate ammonia-lyase [Pikeienuella piscinae]QIE55668.1 diaminopropionate ammonia-lyase [Pikeienuella piscinae]
MWQIFDEARLGHIHVNARPGDAAETVMTRDDFAQAAAEISSWTGYCPTPLHHLPELAAALELGEVLFKDEGPRFGLGSFKALGGAYAGLLVLQRELSLRLDRPVSTHEIRDGSLSAEIAQITLTSATDGNHGRSLAWGARMVGAPCRIYIHKEVSEGRAQAMRDLGAEVVRVLADYDESVRVTRKESEENGWFVVSDTSWEGYTQTPRDVMAGYGVMLDEIAATLHDRPTHLFVQAGVGGLAAAITARLVQKMGRGTRYVVVEPELAACMFASASSGIATAVPVEEETLMAGLSCGEPSPVAWEVLREEVEDFVTVPESLVGPAMRLAARPLGSDPAIAAGESAVCGLAALIAAARQPTLRKALGLNERSRVLLIGSEGVTDADIYAQIVRTP